MFIKSLSYHDSELGWELLKTNFEKLTLLLGLSGVGKSKILDAILNLKDLVLGKPVVLGGVSFELEFMSDESLYRWAGSFDSMNMPYLKSRHRSQISKAMGHSDVLYPVMNHEVLYKEKEKIFERKGKSIIFRGKEIVPESVQKSLFEIFKQDNELSGIRDDFLNIFRFDFMGEMNILIDKNMAAQLGNAHERKIITSDRPVIQKLAFCYLNDKKLFEKIKLSFMDIFPYVEDIFFEYAYNGEYFILTMKEKNTGNITQSYISSGMFKSLMFITQMNLLECCCVVLIDEIENSLGLNCIDLLTDELRRNQSDDQFLITSHHPYIINNIDMEHWRIVSRKGGKVSTSTAKELRLGESSHESFFQLINASEYSEGIK